jgi:hypothetical protein
MNTSSTLWPSAPSPRTSPLGDGAMMDAAAAEGPPYQEVGRTALPVAPQIGDPVRPSVGIQPEQTTIHMNSK